jgi:hypothetical protein
MHLLQLHLLTRALSFISLHPFLGLPSLPGCQLLGDFLAEINHHRGLYDKLKQTQAAHSTAAAAAASITPADDQLRSGGQVRTGRCREHAGAGRCWSSLCGCSSWGLIGQPELGPATLYNASSHSNKLRRCCDTAVLLLLQLLSRAQLAAFCPETLVVASKYCGDFEKYGIHLPSSSQRAEVARLLALNQHYPARFNAALVRVGGWRGSGHAPVILQVPADLYVRWKLQ